METLEHSAIKALGIVLNGEYELRSVDTSRTPVRVRIVGIYEQSDPNDVYWSETMTPYLSSIITDYDCFCNMLSSGGSVQLTEISTRYSLSYQSMDMNDLNSITSEIEDDFELYAELGYDFSMGISDILEEYRRNRRASFHRADARWHACGHRRHRRQRQRCAAGCPDPRGGGCGPGREAQRPAQSSA